MDTLTGPALAEMPIVRRDTVSLEDYADINNELGIINHEKGDLQRAAAFFKKALSLNPDYTEAALNLTITLNDLGQYDEARACISKAASAVLAAPRAVDPYIFKKMADEHARLGTQYAACGLWDEAIEQYQKALQRCPDFVDVVTHLGIAFRAQGNDDEAIRHFSRAKQIHPGYLPAILQLGLTYYTKGFLGLAITQWEMAHQIDPDGKAACAYLAVITKKEEVEP